MQSATAERPNPCQAQAKATAGRPPTNIGPPRVSLKTISSVDHRPTVFAVGDLVEAKKASPDSTWCKAKIISANTLNGTYTVDWEDGAASDRVKLDTEVRAIHHDISEPSADATSERPKKEKKKKDKKEKTHKKEKKQKRNLDRIMALRLAQETEDLFGSDREEASPPPDSTLDPDPLAQETEDLFGSDKEEASPPQNSTLDPDPLGDIMKQIESVRQRAFQPTSRASGKSTETPPGLVKRMRMDTQRAKDK